MKDLLFFAGLYTYIGIMLSLIDPFEKKIYKAPTKDAQLVLRIYYNFLWGLWLVMFVPKFFYYVGKGLLVYGLSFCRGVRDLMPRRAAKIPTATLLTNDAIRR